MSSDEVPRLDREVLDVVETVRLSFVEPDAEDPWANSPFRWLKELPSASRGKAGEKLSLCSS